ncbi:MAG: 4-hydroxyphenylpyruvate dioxygenase [Deltaproteobacteria bacterium]|jgi:4-hydroxyphenylpyruvate dioxygenase|nr:4-hydroxyphenylpyruvate dioxygenase [Deltaproteobacteria bacterium]MBW2537653.1 4-hydroxyphenylpyruvate dioxygenase [Deltaproteobacteria bacterium]
MSSQPTIAPKRIHHVEFWVGNAKQAAYYYRHVFGLAQTAYAGLETGAQDKASYLLEQNRIRFVLSSPLSSEGPIGEHLKLHGDGVRDIAFEVDDADASFAAAVARGAKPASEPRDLEDEHGAVRHASVQTYGDTIHSFISYRGYRGPFLPGFREQRAPAESTGLVLVDHIVGNVEDGQMNRWADYYADVFGFTRYISFDDKDISTEYSALRSVVMSDAERRIKFPINEPAPGKGKSQIQEYIDFYESPGVQHLALLTDDIVATVRKLRANGCEFLEVPDTYYEALTDRVGEIDEPLDAIREQNILVDRDENGYLLQLFTKPVEDRPTLFFEVIQRHGARGFGKGNFKALFESIEREQERRGTL